jgi:hypothetical protein
MKVLLAIAVAAALYGQDPAPAPADQKKAVKSVRERFKEEYRRPRAERAVFARKLMDLGAATQDDRAMRWALLSEAVEVAAGALNLEAAFEAADRLAQAFSVDAGEAKVAALAHARKAAATDPEGANDLADGLATALRKALAAGDLKTAERFAPEGERHAKILRDPIFAEPLRQAVAAVSEARRAFQAELTLSVRDDPEARYVLGKWLWFAKDDWIGGAKHLTAVPEAALTGAQQIIAPIDVALRAVAGKELTRPSGAAEMMALGQAWWEAALKRDRPAEERRRMRARAIQWFENAAAAATGLQREDARRRLEEAYRHREPIPGAVDLLAMVDPKRDLVGAWRVEKGLLVGPEAHGKLQVPYAVPQEYDLVFVTRKVKGTWGLAAVLMYGAHRFMAYVDGIDGATTGLHGFDGHYDATPNETQSRGNVFTDDKPRTLVFSVRKSRFMLHIDGKRMVDWRNADYKRVGVWPDNDVPNTRAIGLPVGGAYEMIDVQLVPLAGEGRRLR